MKRLIFPLLFCLLFPALSFSHPGGVDAQGGHTDKTTGLYHVYNSDIDTPAPVIGQYKRKDWPHWQDVDNDCQDTRAEVLIRDSRAEIKYKRNKPCNVSYGRWICPYTGKVIVAASDADIDHIVPLAHAHKTGGAGWSRKKKGEFANDMDNLLPVNKEINCEKGDKGPEEWRPPLKEYWPEYARRWRAIKKKYGLKVSVREEKALQEMER